MNVDELVFELNLDPRGFTEGQKTALDSFRKTQEEIEKRNKQLESSNKNVGFSFQNITYAAEGLFTALAGAGMASFARDTVNTVAATGRMATNIGESTAALSAFGRMVERNGGDAGAAAGSLKGLTDQMTRLNTFGEGSPELFKFLGIIGGQQGDSPIETFMRFAEWAEKNKNNPQLVNIIGQSGGLDQGTINEALKGRTQVLEDFRKAMAGAIDPAQYAAMVRMQEAWVTLDQAIEKTGRDVVTSVEPAFTAMASSTSQWIEKNQALADTLAKVLTAIVGLSAIKPALWVLRLLGLSSPTGLAVTAAAGAGAYAASLVPADTIKSVDEKYPLLGKLDAMFGLGSQSTPTPDTSTAAGRFTSQADKEAFIRKSATAAGIDPDIAMRVARSEGFGQFSGDNGTSGGAFQLHVTPGGRGGAVGDQFKSLTGLDPLNPENEHESIMFALEWAKRHGWGDYHGAARVGIGQHEGIGEVNITINTPSTDPKAHGKLAADALRTQMGGKITTQANTGLN